MSRYLLKPMRGGFERWGIWDTVEESWHEGEYANAVYAAGIPTWKKETEARAIMTRLNAKEQS